MEDEHRRGEIVGVRGSVVDCRFGEPLPRLNDLLLMGSDQSVAAETASHLGSQIVRSIAQTPTKGLARGDTVIDTG